MAEDAESAGQPRPENSLDRVQIERLEQLRLASLSKLARGMAHDFNNFLMVIHGQSELGLLISPADSPARTQFQQILTASQRAADLCRQLMAYAGRTTLSLAAVDSATLLNEIADQVRQSLSPSCTLRCEWPEQLPPIAADKPQLHAVIRSAICNACEALPAEGGLVILRAGAIDADQASSEHLQPATQLQPGRCVFIEVIDNGCGMDDDTLAQIFDPFFTTKKAHSGMGLSHLQGIVRGHHGAVHVQSVAGQGTTVRILLPVVSESPELAARLQEFLS